VKLQEATTAVRQLEFSLTQLQLQINELLEAFQTLATGKIPPSLIEFDTLQDILKNVTLSLPEGYELVMGTQFNNMPWYFKHVQAALMADLYNFVLVMYFPLITVDRKYVMFHAIAFPSRILNNTYASCKLDGANIAISTLRRTYLLLNDTEMGKCVGETIVVCPADKAVKDTRTASCALSLFFQRRNVREVCHRVITAKQPPAMLEPHGPLVLYYAPEPQIAHFRCHGTNGGWTTHNMLLDGAGTLSGGQSCHIIWGELQLYAEVRGNSQFEVPGPQIRIPPQLTVTSDSELEFLKKISETNKVDELIATVTAHKMEVSVDDLLTLHQLELPHTDNTHWTMPLLLATSSILVAVVMYYCAYTYLGTLLKCCTNKESPDVRNHCSQNSPSQATTSSSEAPATDTLPSASSTRPDFTTYAVHQPQHA